MRNAGLEEAQAGIKIAGRNINNLKEKGTVEDEMVVWHHQLDGHDFDLAAGVGDGQGSLACCSPWGYKELDTAE